MKQCLYYLQYLIKDELKRLVLVKGRRNVLLAALVLRQEAATCSQKSLRKGCSELEEISENNPSQILLPAHKIDIEHTLSSQIMRQTRRSTLTSLFSKN